MIWFTSDPHYHHKKVIGFCGRPFATVEEMNEALIERWNECVRPEDTVYVLGDFCFGGAGKQSEILKRLNGYKILIKGNHDERAHKMLKYGFDEVHYEMLTHIPGLGKVRLSHYPYGPTNIFWRLLFWWKGWDLRHLDWRPKDTGDVLLHGHVHTVWKVKGRQINVGVDCWDYRPVSVDTIKQRIEDMKL